MCSRTRRAARTKSTPESINGVPARSTTRAPAAARASRAGSENRRSLLASKHRTPHPRSERRPRPCGRSRQRRRRREDRRSWSGGSFALEPRVARHDLHVLKRRLAERGRDHSQLYECRSLTDVGGPHHAIFRAVQYDVVLGRAAKSRAAVGRHVGISRQCVLRVGERHFSEMDVVFATLKRQRDVPVAGRFGSSGRHREKLEHPNARLVGIEVDRGYTAGIDIYVEQLMCRPERRDQFGCAAALHDRRDRPSEVGRRNARQRSAAFSAARRLA